MTRKPSVPTPLSKRERQIVDILYRRKTATVGEILKALPDPPTYSAVRATLRILEEKGHIRHEPGSLPYRYIPTVAPHHARRSALRHVVDTFFDGSVEQVVSTLIDESATSLSHEELDRLHSLISRARSQGR
jgi:BlaI family transcriptional regulator, penicillinase repressor